MTKREYIIKIREAHLSMRRALLVTGLPLAALSVAAAAWMFFLARADPDKLPQFFAVVLPILVTTIVAQVLYVGRAFAFASPACPSCGRNVRMLQRRRVVASGKCVCCGGQIFEA
jgi:hypothetical protein